MTRNIYDSGYKYLFSHKAFIRQLLEGFIPFSWVKEIDFDRMPHREEIEAINREDVKTMFAKTIENMKAKYKREGIQAGMQKGLRKGIHEGLQKGIHEGLQKGKMETARKLKARGFDIKTIIEVTGLSKTEINKLKK